MLAAELGDRAPVASIIVPMVDAAGPNARRLASARAQTWQATEVLAVDGTGRLIPDAASARPGGGLGAAIAAGIEACKGDYVGLVLPGTLYMPEKVDRQLDFIKRMELRGAALFCDHVDRRGSATGAVVELPYTDPAFIWQRMLRGFALHFSSLLLPRPIARDLVLPATGPIDAALFDFCVQQSRNLPFVGLAEPLLIVEGGGRLQGSQRCWRDVHARLLKDYLAAADEQNRRVGMFAALGDAASARLGEGLGLAAWDVTREAARLLPSASQRMQAVRTFATPLLRGALRRLPPRLKSLLRPGIGVKDVGARRLDFSAIYRSNGFVGTESLSGAGSTMFQTRVIRREIPPLLRRLGVRRMLDIPCGDFHWMSELDLGDIHYTGADVVPAMVAANRQRYGSATRMFATVDLIRGPLPGADLVLCRDCLVHLPFADALAAIDTIRRSGAAWLLATTFVETRVNQELDAAGWRALNLCLPPFGLPPPRELIIERCTEAGGRAADKALGLWRVADLPATVNAAG